MIGRKGAMVLAGGALVAGAAFFASRPAASVPKTGVGAKEMAGDYNVVGSYKLHGANPDGKGYTGTAGIVRIKDEMYKGTWTIGSTTYQGICFRDEDILSCGWSPKHDLGVMAYLIKDDGMLEGLWFEENHTVLGVENIVGGGKNLLGTYTIKKGETPEKKSYTGTVNIGFENGVYKLDWKIGTFKLKGLGLRNGDILTAGFNDSGEFGVLQYRIKKGGKVLNGQYAMSGGKVPGPGIETAIKEF